MRLSKRTVIRIVLALIVSAVALGVQAQAQSAQPIDVNQKLAGFDAFMEKTLKDWNAPGHWRRNCRR